MKLMRVQGRSMEPTLRPGALVLVDQRVYRRRSPRRGEIVVARLGASGRACVKRLIGLPHDELVVGNRLWQLQADEYFLVGDSRDQSADSRELGPVRQADVVGRVRYY